MSLLTLFGEVGRSAALAPPPNQITVTSSADSGAGTLRQAFADIGSSDGQIITPPGLGLIDLRQDIELDGGGTVVWDNGSNIVQNAMVTFRNCADVEVRNAPMYLTAASPLSTDALSIVDCGKALVHHCELIGANDQVVQVSGTPDFTFRDNIVAYTFGGLTAFFGGLSSGQVYDNLFAHHNARPLFERGSFQLANNVFYNYTNGAVVISKKTAGTDDDVHLDYVNNIHQGGPDRDPSGTTLGYPHGYVAPEPPGTGRGTYFASGNQFLKADNMPDSVTVGDDTNQVTTGPQQWPTIPGDASTVASRAGCTTRSYLGQQVVTDYLGRTRTGVRGGTDYLSTPGGIGWDPITGAPTASDQVQIFWFWKSGAVPFQQAGPGSRQWHCDLLWLQDRAGAPLTGTADLRVWDIERTVMHWELLNHPIGTPIVQGSGTGAGVGFAAMDNLAEGGELILDRNTIAPGTLTTSPFDGHVRVELTAQGTTGIVYV